MVVAGAAETGEIGVGAPAEAGTGVRSGWRAASRWRAWSLWFELRSATSAFFRSTSAARSASSGRQTQKAMRRSACWVGTADNLDRAALRASGSKIAKVDLRCLVRAIFASARWRSLWAFCSLCCACTS